MQQLKTIITAACMLSIAVGICNVLRPSKLFERQVRFLISLLFTLCLAAPLLRIDWHAPLPELAAGEMEMQADRLRQDAQQLILEETAVRTESALTKLLNENGIACQTVDVQVHIDDEQCIYISEVSTACSDPAQAAGLLRTNLGEEVTLHVTELASETAPEG
ncbi:MAG: hypothetical protein IJY06_05225 [Oscillospiraceae bacterium]|nr:hypothetical protein [Oscillospiraceae bacterium]